MHSSKRSLAEGFTRTIARGSSSRALTSLTISIAESHRVRSSVTVTRHCRSWQYPSDDGAAIAAHSTTSVTAVAGERQRGGRGAPLLSPRRGVLPLDAHPRRG